MCGCQTDCQCLYDPDRENQHRRCGKRGHHKARALTPREGYLECRHCGWRVHGGTLGVAFGGAYELSQHWSIGGSFRFGNWFLPSTPAQDPLEDKASVTGRNSVFSLGLNVAYRISL
jgi:hypothetical protein